MNIREVVKKVVLRLFPELANKTHLPMWAVVISVPDPPSVGGAVHSDERPRYAVDCRLLKPDGKTIDDDMPALRDVPVSLGAAAPDRGFAGLPLPGTIVEIAFAYGRQSLPFIRAVLPFKLKLPIIDGKSMRWQQSAASFQEVDADGNWKRRTTGTISDIGNTKCTRESLGEISDTAEVSCNRTTLGEINDIGNLIWIGNETDSMLRIDADFMATVKAALETLASHTHNGGNKPDQEAIVQAASEAVEAEKERLEAFKK